MQTLAGILALLIAIAGWFYLFYSRAAINLAGIEEGRLNARRAVLRRIGGAVMLAIAVLIYAGAYTFDARSEPTPFVIVWIATMFLLAAMVILALVDLRLTQRLRQSKIRPRT